jgi:hypothetical protein
MAVADALAAQTSIVQEPNDYLAQLPDQVQSLMGLRPLSNGAADQLYNALAGGCSFSAPNVYRPMKELKGTLNLDDRCSLDYWEMVRRSGYGGQSMVH